MLHVEVAFVQLGNNTSDGVFLAKTPVVSSVHMTDVFQDLLWYQFTWYVDGVLSCQTVNKSYCLLTFTSAGNYSVNVTAAVIINVTSGAESSLAKKKSNIIEYHLPVKGKQVIHFNSVQCYIFLFGHERRKPTAKYTIVPW